jgi:hypothetical protein
MDVYIRDFNRCVTVCRQRSCDRPISGYVSPSELVQAFTLSGGYDSEAYYLKGGKEVIYLRAKLPFVQMTTTLNLSGITSKLTPCMYIRYQTNASCKTSTCGSFISIRYSTQHVGSSDNATIVPYIRPHSFRFIIHYHRVDATQPELLAALLN